MSRLPRHLLPTLPLLLGAALALAPALGRTAPAPLTKKDFTNSIGMKLVRVPAGKFLMGSPAGEANRGNDEHQHEVEISKSFFLATCEVTQAQYQKVVGTSPSYSSAGGGDPRAVGLDTSAFAVERVSWEDAKAFCEKLSALPAERGARCVYRLPTEAEWEHACRAGTTTPFHFGLELTPMLANFNNRVGRPVAVGSFKKPNAWGLYDMHGNVWEWCADWYGPNYYQTSPKKDPPGPPNGHSRIARGGGWNISASWCRCAYRGWASPSDRASHIGFRVACDRGR